MECVSVLFSGVKCSICFIDEPLLRHHLGCSNNDEKFFSLLRDFVLFVSVVVTIIILYQEPATIFQPSFVPIELNTVQEPEQKHLHPSS
jgi:hypothetical protein